MKKGYLWLIPTTVLICSVIINHFLDVREIYIALIDFIIFVVCSYGIVFVAPCFYIFIIISACDDKKKFLRSLFYAIVCIVVNALIICPKLFLYHLGMLQLKNHDLDLLPMYIILPTGILLVGVCIILLLKKVRRRR